MVQRSGQKYAYIFITQMFLALAGVSVVGGCVAPWRASVPAYVSLPDEEKKGPRPCSAPQKPTADKDKGNAESTAGNNNSAENHAPNACDDFENLLGSVRTTKLAYQKSYEKSADTVVLFDAPLGAVAAAAAGGALFGAPSDLLKGLGLAGGTLLVGRNYISPKESAMAYRLAAMRLACVELRARPLRNIEGSAGHANFDDLEHAATEVASGIATAQGAVTQFDRWLQDVGDLTKQNKDDLNSATRIADDVRKKILEARALAKSIDDDLNAFEERLFTVHATAEAVTDALSMAILDGRSSAFESSLGALRKASEHISGVPLSGRAEGAGTVSVDGQNRLGEVLKELRYASTLIDEKLYSNSPAVQNYPEVLESIKICAKLTR